MKIQVQIYGWNDGFNKVKFNQFLRKEFGFTIREAKNIVDDILSKKRVYLECESKNIETILDDFKLKFQITQ